MDGNRDHVQALSAPFEAWGLGLLVKAALQHRVPGHLAKVHGSEVPELLGDAIPTVHVQSDECHLCQEMLRRAKEVCKTHCTVIQPCFVLQKLETCSSLCRLGEPRGGFGLLWPRSRDLLVLFVQACSAVVNAPTTFGGGPGPESESGRCESKEFHSTL